MTYADTRDAVFGELYEIARARRDVMVLTADTGALKFHEFAEHLPDQFANLGIAEQNAISVAGGLATTGRHVFVFGISNFVTMRCLEQIKVDVCCMARAVTILGLGTGYGYSIDGPTHHVTEDIAIMRALPGMRVWCPSDYTMTAALVRLAADTPGPSYLRIDKGPFTPVYPEGTDFTAGVARVRAGRDVTIVATGIMVTQALAVADALGQGGIEAGIVDVYRLKPANADELLALLAGPTRRIVVLEEHSVLGGLGGLVAEVVAEHDRTLVVKRLGVPDVYHAEVGGREWLRGLDGLDVAGVTASVRRFLEDA